MSDREDAYLETAFRLPRLDPELDYTDPECSCCGSHLPESPCVLGGDLFCDECAIAITEPATVAALLSLGKASQTAVDAYTRTVSGTKNGRWA